MASDRLVSVCRSVEATLRRRLVLPASKCTVIYNGIPTADLAAIPARREDGTIVFGTMARLVPVKDHNSLLKAFASLWHRYPSARLEILGDGELRADLERQAEGLGLRNATRFLGWSADITAFLSRIDVFVLSSLSEGLPLTVLEAMASGKPVVATAVGGVPELVEDANCGWISLPGDSDGLANAMANAISAPDRRERGENGRMRALQRHSLESMCDDYEHLFADVLHRKGRRVATRKDAAVLAIR